MDDEQEQTTERTAATGANAPDDGSGRSASARLTTVASSLAGGAGHVLSAALRPVGEMTSGARRMMGERSGPRVRRVRRMARRPLANMWDEHPNARLASLRDVGLRIVPVDEICGTAVEGPAQRGGDFLPLRERRGRDWRARWQRIRNAMESLVVLPPVDLLKLGDCYWVVDGHNRVAAALYTGQVAVDANVVELRLPGERSEAAEGNVAPYLEASHELRAAGRGRLTRTSVMPSPAPAHPPHEHASDGDFTADDGGTRPPDLDAADDATGGAGSRPGNNRE